MIYPLKETRPNLHFVTGIHVKHVTFDGYVSLSLSFLAELEPPHSENRATGVAFALNPLFHPDGSAETRTVRGTRLVVISAGSFGTPGILERSGIGGQGVLDGVGVKQQVDLPGVGENYQGWFRLPDCRRQRTTLVTLEMCRSQHLVPPVLLRRRGRDTRRDSAK
jgi:alcohol oxidase